MYNSHSMNAAQLDAIAEQYSEIIADGMDWKTMYQYTIISVIIIKVWDTMTSKNILKHTMRICGKNFVTITKMSHHGHPKTMALQLTH